MEEISRYSDWNLEGKYEELAVLDDVRLACLCDIDNKELTHHIPPFHCCYCTCQVALRDVKPLNVRRDMLDDGFGFSGLLPNDIDLLNELLKDIGPR